MAASHGCVLFLVRSEAGGSASGAKFEVPQLSHLAATAATSTSDTEESAVAALERHHLLAPSAVHNLLYRVDGDDDGGGGTTTVSPGDVLGVVHVQWQHCMGETGAMSSAPVRAPPPTPTEVEVKAASVPQTVKAGGVFVAELRVSNCGLRR